MKSLSRLAFALVWGLVIACRTMAEEPMVNALGETETVSSPAANQLEETVPTADAVQPSSEGQSAGIATQSAAPPSGSPVLRPSGLMAADGDHRYTPNPFLVLFGLALIVAIIYLVAWLMKRAGLGNLGGMSGMKVVAGMSVGPREKVLLLEVGERQVLIGVAPGRVSHLESFEKSVLQVPDEESVNFSERLKAMLATGRSHN